MTVHVFLIQCLSVGSRSETEEWVAQTQILANCCDRHRVSRV